jgi:serine/threonine protein kinase
MESPEYKKNDGFCYENMYIAITLLSSLLHIHQKNIFHCDIKPENVAISWGFGQVNEKGQKKYTASIIDFGLSGDDKMIQSGGTRVYFSPEQESSTITKALAQKSDIFSMGIVLWELFSKDNIHSRSHNDIVRGTLQVFSLKVDADPNYICRYITHHMLRCLEFDPSRRPTANELLSAFSEVGKMYFNL